jgi:hypothetical protein
MKHVIAFAAISACLLVLSGGVVFAVESPHGSTGPHPGGNAGAPNGQPGTGGGGASCGTLTGGAPPGQTGAGGLSSMSPFALDAVGLSKNYAGSTTPLANPGNINSAASPHANSQYDVACFQPHIQLP